MDGTFTNDKGDHSPTALVFTIHMEASGVRQVDKRLLSGICGRQPMASAPVSD
jgi:hypothetical protein